MNTTTTYRVSPEKRGLQPRDLEYIAYSGHNNLAHGIFRGIDPDVRRAYVNKYVFQSVIIGGIQKLQKFLSSSAEEEAKEEKDFLDRTMLDFLEYVRAERQVPRELFETTLAWCDELSRLSLLDEALQYYDRVLLVGASRYPELYARLIDGKAGVLVTMGRFDEAEDLLRTLVDRVYVLTDRNFIADAMFSLSQVFARRGDLTSYSALLFRGLRLFYTNRESRRRFFEQLRKTYRRSYKVLFDPQRTFSERLLFVAHWVYFRIERNRLARLIRFDRAVRLLLLGALYFLSFVWRKDSMVVTLPATPRNNTPSFMKRKNGSRGLTASENSGHILVTRAMGGIGDLLMMTPGLHALKKSYPEKEIHFAIPGRYFPLFEGNRDVRLVDIDQKPLQPRHYWKWFNLSECPAARVESRTAPHVRKNRIEIFARSLGIGLGRLRVMERKPRYYVSPDDREWQREFWRKRGLGERKVVGIQLHSEESYRDYPHMGDLVKALTVSYDVIVFDGDTIFDSFGPRTVVVGGLEMRKAFALAAACDAVVCPDSAFVHLAAAFDIPCVALYGPTDGSIRTRDYPRCVYLDARDNVGCLPCWRNESIVCKLTNMRASVCMADIPVTRVLRVLDQLMDGKGKP